MTDTARVASLFRRLAPAVVIVGGLVLLGGAVRDYIGFEATGEWVREWVGGFGIWGPAVYTALLSVRHLFGLPSSIMLTLGGVAFGVVGGTLTGGLGLFFSGLMVFYLFRVVRPEGLIRRMEVRYGHTDGAEWIERGTPLALVLMTAVPPAPQTLLYWLVSATRISFLKFAVLILPAGIVRALVLSVLGVGLVDENATMIVGAGLAITLGLGLCWLSPTVRAVLLPEKSGPPAV
ncbi:MAG: VTT domain-containing protein [Myxococcota bacterium]|nr:VTT domain-containing protein [Myxococcota bacterium]